MDPFSAEGELLNIRNAFHQGQYQEVIDFDTSKLSSDNTLPAQVLKWRAQIANGQAKVVLDQLAKESNSPDNVAVKAFALLNTGKSTQAQEEAEELAETSAENATVQVMAGTILQAVGKSEEALTLLSKHQGNLEAIALIVQIHLQQNRTDLALKEVTAARKWAQDNLLVNIAESWLGLRLGGDKYQQAFYVFDEMAQTPSTSTAKSLIGQAVAEMHLGRFPEAEAALQQALEKEPENADAIANSIVLNVFSGKESSELKR
ncbi:coatomer subunit epsilon [Physcia stellaris]|nr:coatomer subunit epsilon [Physcia stellaris]